MSSSEKLPPALQGKLPAPVDYAGDIAKLATGVGAVFAGVWFPETAALAAFAATVLPFAIDRLAKRPTELLLEELRKGNVQNLSEEQLTAFIPMDYKFLEAAKEGECERNLRILAAYLVGELKQDVPDPSRFSRMVRRVEGLSSTDLQVIALIDVFLSQDTALTLDAGTERERRCVSTYPLMASQLNKSHLTHTDIEEALVDLVARGFLIADGSPRYDKFEEYYFASSNLQDLMDRARERIEQAGSDDNVTASESRDHTR